MLIKNLFMLAEKNNLTESESLELIAMMINKAKDSYRDTGIGAIMWGAVIAICSLTKLAELYFNFRLSFDIYLLTFFAIIPQIFITIREKKKRRVKRYDEVFTDNLWLAFGICIFLLVFIINVIFNAWQPVAIDYKKLSGVAADFRFSEFTAPLFLLLYGLPTFVTGAACKVKPMFWGGLLCWVCCIVTAFTKVEIDLLLTAFAAIAAWLIPGLIMKRDYNKAKIELAQTNV